jgi:hypothetical protein
VILSDTDSYRYCVTSWFNKISTLDSRYSVFLTHRTELPVALTGVPNRTKEVLSKKKSNLASSGKYF